MLLAADIAVVLGGAFVQLEAAVSGELPGAIAESRHLLGIHGLKVARDGEMLVARERDELERDAREEVFDDLPDFLFFVAIEHADVQFLFLFRANTRLAIDAHDTVFTERGFRM
ncbi:MAG TPA: hypothetical protein VMG40_17115 [Bryobacteraceae bacterium]|nr:hypothetical protein [Bryobacteraceae bacterium]